MNKNYEISLNLYEINKDECLPNILFSLSKLDNIKENIFYDINKGLQTRIERLQNFKSRINRIKQIISSLNNVTQAMMIKSKKYYPNIQINFHKNIYLEEDINGINNIIISKRNDSIPNNKKLNSKPLSNPKENLLTSTHKFSMDNALLEESLILTMEKYNDLSRELFESRFKNIGIINEKEEGNNLIYEHTKYTNSEFSFFDKELLQKETIPWEIRKDYDTQININAKEKEELNKKELRNNKKKEIQEAPISIQTGEKLTTYVVSKKSFFQRSNTTNTESQLNIPLNLLNLKGVTDITNINPSNNTHVEELFTPKEPVQIPQQQEEEEIYQENIQDIEVDELPIDKIIERNQSKTMNEINTNIQTPTSNYQTIQTTTNTNNTIQTTTTVPTVSSVPSVQTVPSVTTIPSVPTNPSISTVPTIQSNPSVPIVTSVPNVPSVPIPTVVSAPKGGNIPVPPPIPPLVINVKPKVEPPKIKPKEEEKKSNDDGNENNIEENKEEIPVKKQMSMYEEMALIKLKPKGSTKVEEKAPKNVSMMDNLKEQIKLRFKQLNEHKKESESSDENNDDDDE
jgi:hypothetical protein